MKIWKLSLLLVCFAAWNAHAQTQQDVAATKILNEVSKKYDSYKTVKASFSFKVTQGVNGNSYTDDGTLLLDKANNKYFISMKSQDLISDAKSTWTVLKEDKEVQIAGANYREDAIDPSNIFTFYKKGFKYVRMDDQKAAGITLNVIELSPTDTKKNYFKIRLRIDSKTKLIYDATIFDKSSGQYTYSIKSQTGNVGINAKDFSFNKSKYPGFELVDLR